MTSVGSLSSTNDAISIRLSMARGLSSSTASSASVDSAIGAVGLVARLRQRALGQHAVRHITADTLSLRVFAHAGAHGYLAPGDPARSGLRSEFLVVDGSAIGQDHKIGTGSAQGARAANEFLARPARQGAKGVIG